MKVVNFGSLNIDHIYRVSHAVTPGETLAAAAYQTAFGGKGLNQSIAIARAGRSVSHAGCVGSGGQAMAEYLRESGVDISLLRQSAAPQGHAVIQVNDSGNNCIIIFGGSNREVTTAYIDQVLAGLETGDLVVLQNEVSNVDYIIRAAHARGCVVVFNASPIDESVLGIDYSCVDWLIINEIEGAAIAGVREIGAVIPALAERWPALRIILTLGEEGSLCYAGGTTYRQAAFPARAVDTTAAGDTFLGYCVAGLMDGTPVEEILRTASAASAIAVSTLGAAASIPARDRVDRFLTEAGGGK